MTKLANLGKFREIKFPPNLIKFSNHQNKFPPNLRKIDDNHVKIIPTNHGVFSCSKTSGKA